MNHEFPWQEDNEGEFLILRADTGDHELRQSNTELFFFPTYQEGSHIWHEVEAKDEDVNLGLRLYKPTVDEALGDGAYESLVSDMAQRYFTQIISDTMCDYDLAAFRDKFGREPMKIDMIGKIVDLAVLHIDSEWAYYEKEWT